MTGASAKLVLWSFGLALLLAGGPASAQTPLSGVVRDETGLGLPGVTVEVRTDAGVLIGATTTRADGTWRLSRVPDETLLVVISLTGFTAATFEVPAPGNLPGPLQTTLALGGFSTETSVTATRDERSLATIPSAVSVLSGPLVRQATGKNLVETLRFVPGVAAGDVSGVDDLRISIRGAGIRAGFGSRGVVLMADGFPVTEPDGQTPHFDGQIDLSSAERVEVVKGPTSAIYGGAALGGVVNVVTAAPSRQPSMLSSLEVGSYEFGKFHVAASSGAGPFVVGGTLGYTHLDGFRDHNSLQSWAGTGRADWSDGSSSLRMMFLASDAELELPGSLNREQFETDPSQTRPVYVVNDWGRENRVIRFGGRYEWLFANGQSIEVDSYGQTRDLFHPIFVVIDQDAKRYVGHARYRLARGAHRFATGLDVDRQQVDDRWYVNAGGEPGFQVRDDDNLIGNVGLYAQDEIALGDAATLVAGLRVDRIDYDLEDLRTADGDASDQRTFTRVSPKIGVTARAGERHVLYANVASGFEAPTLGEVRLPAGFNTTVKPQTAVSVEGGVRSQLARLTFDVAAYYMQVNDEILPETIDNVTVYRNVAEAGHTGVEASARLRAASGLTVEGTYAWSRFVLEEFGEFSGNRLPGVPAHMGSARVHYAAPAGWEAGLHLVWAGDAFVSDANTEAADGYAVVSAQGAYQLRHLRVFARAENLGNVTYTNRVQVNDSGGFYYYPAPGRQFMLGAAVRW